MRVRRPLFTATAAGLTVLLLGGCVGRFPVTHKVLDWNRSVTQEKWVHEGIFIGLLIVPVYPLAVVVDALVMNAAEFWTGERVLVRQSTPQRLDAADGSHAIATYRPASDSFDIEAFEVDGSRHFVNVARSDTGVLLFRDAAGQVLALREHPLTALARLAD